MDGLSAYGQSGTILAEFNERVLNEALCRNPVLTRPSSYPYFLQTWTNFFMVRVEASLIICISPRIISTTNRHERQGTAHRHLRRSPALCARKDEVYRGRQRTERSGVSLLSYMELTKRKKEGGYFPGKYGPPIAPDHRPAAPLSLYRQ